MLGLALIAREVDATSFGAVSTAFVIVAIAMSAERGMWGESLLILVGHGPERRPDLVATAMRGAALLGVVLSCALVAIAGLASGDLAPVLAVAGLGLPVVLAQDAGRFVFFAQRRPQLAFASDLVWLIWTIVALVIAASFEAGTTAMLGLYFVGAVPALLVVVVWKGDREGRPAVRRWLVDERHIVGPLTGDVVGGPGFRALALAAVIALVGLVEGGGFRGAQLLMGPITVLSLAASPVFLSRMSGAPADRIRKAVAGLTAAFAVAGGLWMLVLLLLPESATSTVLGDAARVTAMLIVPVGVYQVASAVSLSPFLGLRAERRTGVGFRLRLVSGVLLVAAASTGALVGGAELAAWSMTGVELVTLFIGWRWLTSGGRPGSRVTSVRAGKVRGS